MKKILFIVTKSENGGAQRWVKEQIDILDGIFESYIVTDEEGWLIQHAKATGFMTDQNIKSLFSFSFLKKFATYVEENKIDLIVSGTANAGVYGRLVKLFYDTKVLYVSHGWSSIYNGGKMKFIYTTVEKLLANISESVLCVSDSDYDRARYEIGIKESKLKFIKNKSLPVKKRDDTKIKDKRVKIVNVARFREPKRQDLLIDAVRDLNVDLYLVGDGPLRASLQKRATSNVHFLGEVDGFEDFYKYDIFSLISDSEGLPLAGVEAMGAGLPLILSNVGGCPELIDGNGVLVENDERAIKDGIKDVMENVDRYSKRSVEIFDKEFNLSKHRDLYIDYYRSFLDD
jgi:glycosyltransferase involved in cell wall biosynthesis